MRSVLAVRTAICAVAFMFFSIPDPARACSICQAGDPLFSSGGASAMEAGRFSAFLELQAWQKSSGLLAEPGEEPEPGQEENRGRQLSLYLAAAPIDRVTVTLQLPWRWNEISEQPQGEEHETSKLDGFGDLVLNVGTVLWRDRDVLPASWVEVRAFLKAPTGASEQRVNGHQDPHLQVGTGSWDFGFGLAGAHRFEWASLYASTQYRENRKGSLHYRYGDVVLANLALETPLSHWLDAPLFGLLTAGGELNFRYAGKDRSHGAGYDDSGGSILYATPSLRIRLPIPGRVSPSIRLAVQIPLTDAWLNGQQDEQPVYSAGIGAEF